MTQAHRPQVPPEFYPAKVLRAAHAGYCGGVARATRRAYQLIAEQPLEDPPRQLYMLGELIHNRSVTDDLKAQGMALADSPEDLPSGSRVLIRAHGIAPQTRSLLESRACQIEDATCPYVTKIHQLAAKASQEGRRVILLGDPKHPEVIGIVGAAGGRATVLASVEEARSWQAEDASYVLLEQTTFSRKSFGEIREILKNKIAGCEIFDTICEATSLRQSAAQDLASRVDLMLVIGSETSSNTRKLYEICQSHCGENYLVETPDELRDLLETGTLAGKTVGVTAGASSPESIIREVFHIMSENTNGNVQETMEEQQTLVEGTAQEVSQEVKNVETGVEAAATEQEQLAPATEEAAGQPAEEAASESAEESVESMGDISFTDAIDMIPQLKRGAIVSGVIVRYDSDYVYVDVRDKSEGKIPMHEFRNLDFDLDEAVRNHEELEVYVRSIRNTDMGKEILLSKARVDYGKYKAQVEEAYKNKTPITVKVVSIVKDGVIASFGGVDIYIHRTQLELGIVEDLEPYKDQELEILVTQFDAERRRLRVAGSRRQLLNRERRKKAEEVWANIEIGDMYEGVVRSLTNFGAFVDIGGVDGLVHISELSWNRIKHPSEVVKVGDVVQVYIKDFDKENKRIKLGYKRIEDDPYYNVEERFPVGSIVHGKVMRMLNFGVFIQIAEGVDAFCHISQISSNRLNKPDDVLSVGQEVDARVVDVKNGDHRIGISIRDVAPINSKDGSEPVINTRKTRNNEEVATSYSDADKDSKSSDFSALSGMLEQLEGDKE